MSQDCCSICLEALISKRSRPVGAASCGHCLHTECFFRWKASKSNPYYDDDIDSADIPCPQCNQPIEQFVRLYISSDQSENERLKKELKSAKRKFESPGLDSEIRPPDVLSTTSGDAADESRPDPPSLWSMEDLMDDTHCDTDGNKMASWVDRMAIAVSQVSLSAVMRGSSSPYPEDPPCDDQ